MGVITVRRPRTNTVYPVVQAGQPQISPSSNDGTASSDSPEISSKSIPSSITGTITDTSTTFTSSTPSSTSTLKPIGHTPHGVSNTTLAISLTVSLGVALIIGVLAFLLIRRRRQRHRPAAPTGTHIPAIREKSGLLQRRSTTSSSRSRSSANNISRLVISPPRNLQYFQGCGTSPLHAQLRAQCDTPTYPSPTRTERNHPSERALPFGRQEPGERFHQTPLLPDAPPPPYIQEPAPELPELPPNLARMSYPTITVAGAEPVPRPVGGLRASATSMFSFLHKNPISPVPPAIPQLPANLGRWSYQQQLEAERQAQPQMQQLPRGEYLRTPEPGCSEYGPSPDLRLSTLAEFPRPPKIGTERCSATPPPLTIHKHKPKSKSFARPFTPPLHNLISRAANVIHATKSKPIAPATAPIPSSSPALSYPTRPTLSLTQSKNLVASPPSPTWHPASSPYCPSPGPSFLESPIDPEGWVGGGLGKTLGYGAAAGNGPNPYRNTRGLEPSPRVGVARGSGVRAFTPSGYGGYGAALGVNGAIGLAHSKSVRSFTSTLYSDTASLHEVQGIEAVTRSGEGRGRVVGLGVSGTDVD
ncbi:unnamed protein product [Zymoseptoria tritici ST99CH_1A5]|uniref:Uncharacterized protein n=2 Tax=Zymoseptoria tritici TaxID=1047171 RepID=A0A2H1GPS7_ZYMTR|nr:unnamed protein product [Zymoseptoria tritici ST99CH_1E4]SMY26333.1 unnamed protein product [Zymoseptoria tritici ST99CH_1A5]